MYATFFTLYLGHLQDVNTRIYTGRYNENLRVQNEPLRFLLYLPVYILMLTCLKMA